MKMLGRGFDSVFETSLMLALGTIHEGIASDLSVPNWLMPLADVVW
jgi:hypothetical protein